MITQIEIKNLDGVVVFIEKDIDTLSDKYAKAKIRELKKTWPQTKFRWTVFDSYGDLYTTFTCADNNNALQFHFVDGEIDEMDVATELRKDWTIIGFEDLKTALATVGYDVIKREGDSGGDVNIGDQFSMPSPD